MSPVHLRNLGFQGNQPEDREGLSRTRIPRRGPLEYSGGWNLKAEDWKDMDQILQLRQLKDLFQWSMDNKRFNLAGYWAELGESLQKIFLKEIEFRDLMVITKGWNPNRQFRLLEVRANRIRENQATIQAIEEHLTQTDQWPRVTILQNPRKIPGEDKDTRAKPNHLQTEEERVRPNDPAAVEFGERSAKEPELVVNNSRISRPINRKITPTHIEHNVATPESNLNSDALWLQMSQFAEQTQKQFSECQASH
ncbi:hypothetical protein O181_000892 [Austropuccinia psidii MF-1]|uniref:Uncharacterized protein n=1 Tax=Austropuccinia psidii MF-1 TaxID=1389203 RepID=A0A9Q3B9R9_9BASI|nr:hypothetical protein [Austropuccinia psidii MF-1]